MLKVLTTLAIAASAHAAAPIDECSGYGDCGDCLQHDYCGWCSPSPVIYNNGTTGARCADQRDAPWVCENVSERRNAFCGAPAGSPRNPAAVPFIWL